jgi:hypothetical protein
MTELIDTTKIEHPTAATIFVHSHSRSRHIELISGLYAYLVLRYSSIHHNITHCNMAYHVAAPTLSTPTLIKHTVDDAASTPVASTADSLKICVGPASQTGNEPAQVKICG